MNKKRKKKRAKSAEPIALCMIVKNEAANLPRCLESVKGLVSEINIVDTGSTDDTIRIAKSLGARVRSEEWADDFSLARNASLEMARAHWILILDADEVLAPDAIARIKFAVRRPGIAAYLLPTRNYMNDSAVANFVPNDGGFGPARAFKGWVESRKIRLFRNLPDIRFEGEIHEVVGPSIRRICGREEFLNAVVHHFGFVASENALRKKTEERVRLAEAKCASQSDNYKPHYELGVILAELGSLEKAEQCFRKSIALRNDFALAHYDLGVVLSRAGRDSEAVTEYREALKFGPDSADALNNLADSLQKLRGDKEAEQAYRSLLEKHPSYKRGWNNLGALLASTGRLDEAKRAFKAALKIDAHFADAARNLRSVERMKPEESAGSALPAKPAHLLEGISLSMIVRNEEKDLPELLEQMRHVVDEMVVVDTGSSDNTRAFAEASGARVYEFPWADDFSAARNFSSSKATREWIFVLDADERISPGDLSALRALTTSTHASGFSFETRNYSRDSALDGWRPASPTDDMKRSFPGWFPSEKVRLFRNLPSLRFDGAIHELVEPSIRKANGLIERARIPVHHYGYDRSTGKAEAYLTPARQKAFADPQNAQAHFELAAVYYRLARFNEARASLRTAVGLAPGNVEYMVALGDSLRVEGAVEESRKTYQEAISLSPNASAAHRGMGILLFHENKFGESRKAFEKAFELNPHDAQSLTNIGVIHAKLLSTKKAIECFQRALEINPQTAIARSNLEFLTSSHPSPTLCLLMIVKDEQRNLTESLPDLAPYFDELVVVDTGSGDDTVEVARKYTDDVFTFPWSDDFSAARNFALSKAKADWILWLDADDRMTPDSATSLRQRVKGEKKGYLIRIVSSTMDSDIAEFLQLRLFPNIGGVRWEGRIHEQILPAVLRQGLPVEAIPDVAIFHKGYDDPAIQRKKTLRNVELLEAERNLKPDDPTVLHHLAQGYSVLGETAKATEVLEAIVQSQPFRPSDEFLPYAMNKLVQSHLAAGNLEEASEWAERVLKVNPEDLLARYFLGEIHYRQERFDKAIERLEQFCSGRETVGLIAIPWAALKANAHNYLGLAYERIGQRDRARLEFGNAIEQGGRAEAYKNLARLYLNEGNPDEAASVLRIATEKGNCDPDIWVKFGVALADSQKFEEAEKAFRRALEIEPGNPVAAQNLEYVCTRLSKDSISPCKLSLNMIVRDEAENLRAGLAPIANLFDEIIIVDTGSRDDTVEVAKQLGARVIRHPWNDDFAEARNTALKNSKGEWIFWLDADDRIDPSAIRTVRKFVARGIDCGVFFPLQSAIGDNGSVVQNYALRLFPNRPGITWTGAVHEQITHSLRSSGIELVNCPDFTIRHVGYEKQGEALTKNLRNLKLLAKELSTRPDDPYVLFALAQVFLFCGQLQHAEKWLRVLWDLRGKANGDVSKEVFWMAAVVLSDCAVTSGNADEAEEWLEQAIELWPDNWLAYFLLGEKKLYRGDRARAAHLLGSASKIGIGPTILPVDLDEIRAKTERYLAELRQ